MTKLIVCDLNIFAKIAIWRGAVEYVRFKYYIDFYDIRYWLNGLEFRLSE